MRSRRRPLLHPVLWTVALVLAASGCRFDSDYIAAAEEGTLEPEECPQEGGASIITRSVLMAARFMPEAGATEYRMAFSYLPIDPTTGAPTGDPVRHVRAPAGAASGDAGGLSFEFYTCVLQGAYEVTALAVRAAPPGSAPLFATTCEGELTTMNTSVIVSQDTPFGPVTISSCLDAP